MDQFIYLNYLIRFFFALVSFNLKKSSTFKIHFHATNYGHAVLLDLTKHTINNASNIRVVYDYLRYILSKLN